MTEGECREFIDDNYDELFFDYILKNKKWLNELSEELAYNMPTGVYHIFKEAAEYKIKSDIENKIIEEAELRDNDR